MDFVISYDPQTFSFDFVVQDGDFATDNGLLTAVLISLFTDRRANDDDVIPDGTGNRRGSWQDQYLEVEGDLLGSRLWLLGREKELSHVLQRAQMYAEEALAWMVEDVVARSVTVTAEWSAPGVLGLLVENVLIDGSPWTAVINYPLEG